MCRNGSRRANRSGPGPAGRSGGRDGQPQGPARIRPEGAAQATERTPGEPQRLDIADVSREAALAVKSAVPLVQLAGRATVLAGSDRSADSLAALKMYLQSYGVAITVEEFTADQMTARGRARALLKTAEELSADLLVMGAYGENAIGALFGLGRATRKIVTAARMPVLLHH